MRPVIAGALLAAALALGASEPAPSPQSFVDLFKAATAAHDAKDYATMEQKLREALKLRPAHPAALYNLAAAQALKGERKDAMETLEGLVEMGLYYEPGKDPDFAVLANSERFTGIGKDFAKNARPAGRTRTVLRVVNRPTFIPEGLAYDDDEHEYFIGSVHERVIQRGKAGGDTQAFVLPGATMWAPLGMAADTDRHLLWVATAAIPEMGEPESKDISKSAIVAFDLRSGERKRRYLLEEPGEHQLGDLTLARNGTIYTTDAKAGVLYALDTSSGKFEALTKPGELASPQGVVQGRDRNVLFVADYTQGLFRYDLYRKELRRLDVSRDICVYGIDGLYRYKDDLVAVQNGLRPHRVVQFELDDRGRRVTRARVLASAQPYFDEPTLGVVIDDHFDFVANSQWNKFDAQHRLPSDDKLKSPLVLRVDLDPMRERRNPEDQLQPQPQGTPGSAGGLPPLPCVGPLCR